MRLLSISCGKVAPLFGEHQSNEKAVTSAIRKRSISDLSNPSPVVITNLGVKDDEQADRSVHGGIEKAIYTYPAEHYAFWNELLTRETKKTVALQYGAIGENFTIEGLLESQVYVGDTLIIGGLEFSVVKLREPCFKFNAAMGYKGAAKAMLQSGCSGWYLRVHQEGVIAAGAEIKHIHGSKKISIAAQNAALLNGSHQKNLWE
ncbi:MOSC domain-containing protein [Polynucleobacter sp. Latsch14-2]|jgi:MOSC domain-containing protein YiiM|uniref:MOSC domain-containing protein n=1 Tax=Polynucleobacter sp. Latsch14-2 TaxID=2576920 RepID=UPI001C0E2D4E|nr:MOSC domain-containing protein [Polynucleobacter sp. Latsch14-2]MBU3613531.1 MOSC domain-containing protein [Polynucleobacter sp. Latsch14-2]